MHAGGFVQVARALICEEFRDERTELAHGGGVANDRGMECVYLFVGVLRFDKLLNCIGKRRC